jgi:hypothetical protein
MSQGFPTYQEFGEAEQDREGVRAADAIAADIAQPSGNLNMMCEDLDSFCENHLDLASQAAVQRKDQMQKRIAFVQDLWNDADRFDNVVASGRYLKLCHLTEWISEYDERAWERVKSEILAVRQKIVSSLS